MNSPKKVALHDKLTEIAGRVRVLSLVATGLATIANEEHLSMLADLADAIEAETKTFGDLLLGGVIHSTVSDCFHHLSAIGGKFVVISWREFFGVRRAGHQKQDQCCTP
jgi:hypothetical protein